MNTIRITLSLIAILFATQTAFAQKEFTINGRMHHSDLEGGCWYLEAKNMKYELVGSPEFMQTCRVEGRMLSLSVTREPRMASTCMIGQIVRVVAIFDTIMHPVDPSYKKETIKGTVHRNKQGCWYVLSAHHKRYELQAPIPKRFMKLRAKYNRLSTVLSSADSGCGMDGVIVFSGLEPDMH
ncbi:MAG: hypothetical protein WCH46_04305 [bacterium]